MKFRAQLQLPPQTDTATLNTPRVGVSSVLGSHLTRYSTLVHLTETL